MLMDEKRQLIILKAVSNSTRLKIIKLLLEGEKCVCNIFPKVNRTQSTVSIHLNILENAKIIKSKKEGKWVHYSINNKNIKKILDLLEKE